MKDNEIKFPTTEQKKEGVFELFFTQFTDRSTMLDMTVLFSEFAIENDIVHYSTMDRSIEVDTQGEAELTDDQFNELISRIKEKFD